MPPLATTKFLLSIINCIIDNSQIENMTFSYQFKPFILAHMLADVIELFSIPS